MGGGEAREVGPCSGEGRGRGVGKRGRGEMGEEKGGG